LQPKPKSPITNRVKPGVISGLWKAHISGVRSAQYVTRSLVSASWHRGLASYFFRNGVLYRSEVHLGTDYDEVINLLTARYGKPASRQNQFEMIDGRVSTHVTWFKAAAFDVLAYQESYVDEQGNSRKVTYVLSTNESRTKKEKENTNF
jgi:hypothetical protein